MKQRVLIGTRGSALALAQTGEVVNSLRKVAPQVRCEIVSIKTKGDTVEGARTGPLENKSVFTKEIEDSLIQGHVDLAVHSMKDLTTDLPPDLVIACIPERVDARDVLISRNKKKFQQLDGGARVGTSSPRRKAQLLAARGDLEIVEMHGNIDTRLRKLDKGECDAIILAAAGLIRLGLEGNVTEFLSPNVMLPAVGQGAIAIQSREDDAEIRNLLAKLEHEPTRRAIEAERGFARRLGADCRTPTAAYARFENGKLTIDGMVAAASGKLVLRARIVSDNPNAEKAGEELAESLLKKGAEIVLEAA
jgi:hydroxymethylbilane synthase